MPELQTAEEQGPFSLNPGFPLPGFFGSAEEGILAMNIPTDRSALNQGLYSQIVSIHTHYLDLGGRL